MAARNVVIKMIEPAIKKVFISTIRNFPPVTANKIYYLVTMRKKLDLMNPKTFNEKIMWLKIFGTNDLVTQCTDKLLVRDYVKEKGEEGILIKLLGVYRNPNGINYDELPAKFVLKANHGCGFNVICKDKKYLNIQATCRKLSRWLAHDYSKESFEYQYKNIKRLIICEEFIGKDNGELPTDYKIYCFKGVPFCVLVCSDRENDLRLDYYDKNWSYLNYAKDKYKSGIIHPKPEGLQEMLKIAHVLSEPFAFVRVDLYYTKNKIYFGEMTFTPYAGVARYNTEEAQNYLGQLINLA